MQPMGSKHIGFIGLGAMGLPMAKNLLNNGYELHVATHRNREPVEALKQAGATEHSSISGVVVNSDVLISILPEDQEMQEVLLSAPLLNGIRAECVLIEMTSGSPGMMKKVNDVYKEKGIRVLDAPVSGGTIGAANGTLTVMAGGEEKVLQSVRPVLEAMAKNIYLVGDVGAGKAIKAINQMLAGIHMIASAEAAALGEKLGIDKEMMKQVIGNSSGASWMLLNKLDSLSERSFAPGFKHKLMKKDVQIAVNEGADLALPLASFALQLYKMSEKELGEMDFSAISKHILS
jgi:3-hydroxyisobutyrate dehydrogenase-like beta-hydroxyacid dehydrogenase